MFAVITGDIINSRKVEVHEWLPVLRGALSNYGDEFYGWEVYRGDSFQLQIDSKIALLTAIVLKSTIKKINSLDVRLAIGIGGIDYKAEKITESNGSAFINSGECFENLKKRTIAIKTPFGNFDKIINIMLELAELTMNNWSMNSAEILNTAFLNPMLNQRELADILNRQSQSTISEGLKRGGFEEIRKMIKYYEEEIVEL